MSPLTSRAGRRTYLVAFIAGCLGASPDAADAATARSFGQPISGYSAKLFGKTNLTGRQTQTLTADPEAPLYGATSVEYDPAVVSITGFGFGPAYIRSFLTPAEFQSGAAIELDFSDVPVSIRQQAEDVGGGVDHVSSTDMVDLGQYLDGALPPQVKETGYLQLFYELDEVGQPGTFTPPDETLIGSNAPVPGGVDTHFFTFEYNDGIPNSIPASYRVFDDFGARTSGNITDFMASGDPNNPDITEPGEIVDAVIFGTIPEPAGLGLVAIAMYACASRTRRASNISSMPLPRA